jgi:hypothetical protein
LKPVTKAKYRLMLELLRERNGDRPISGMASKNVMNLLATKSGKSGAQRNMRSIVKTLLGCGEAGGALRSEGRGTITRQGRPHCCLNRRRSS